jgi:hypothetical protein
MKLYPIKYAVTLIISAFLVWSCDNPAISDLQQKSFIKFYGTGIEDEGMKVITTTDGYLLMGNIENPGRGKDICIIKTDHYGNSEGPIKVYGGFWDDMGYAIKPDSLGYVIVGSTHQTEFSDKDVYVVQIDPQGDTLWTRSYDRDSHLDDEAYDFLVLDNGHLIITGYTQNNLDNKVSKDYLFLETDADGRKIIFEPKGVLADEVAFSVVKFEDTYLFAGYTEGAIRSMIVFRWSGTTSPYVIIPSSDVISEAKAIIPVNNNEFVVAATVQPDQSAATYIKLMRINATGSIIWEKQFGKLTMNSVSSLAFHNDSLYTVGTTTDGDTQGDILLIKTDLYGDDPSYFEVGDGVSYEGNGFDFALDGGFIITGANFLNENSVIALIKLDQEGNLR